MTANKLLDQVYMKYYNQYGENKTDEYHMIEENIIPYRKTYNIDKADRNKVWGYVLYDGGSKEDYILKIINKISEIFNNYLSEMPEIKKWLEGSVVPDVRDMKRGGKGTRRMKRKMKNKTRKC